MLSMNTTNTTNTDATIRSVEKVIYSIFTVGIPIILWQMSKDPYWVGAVPILEAAVSFAKQKGWLPTTLTLQQ